MGRFGSMVISMRRRCFSFEGSGLDFVCWFGVVLVFVVWV